MQGIAAALLCAVVAAPTPLAGGARTVAASPVGEAYVAELDADWNVKREIRVPCPADMGCAIDLGLADGGPKAVHVLFDPLRSGKVAVTSRFEGEAGAASPARGETLSVDRSGFGASHYEIDAAGRTLLVAVRVPGWTATGVAEPDAGGQRT